MKGLQALAFGKCPAQFWETTQLGLALDEGRELNDKSM